MNDYEVLEYHKVKELIAKHCRFSLGKQMLLKQEPSYHFLWIKQENQRLQEAIDVTVRYGHPAFPSLHDIEQSLKDAQKDMALRPWELQKIAAQGYAVKSAVNYQKRMEIDVPYLNELFHSLSDLTSLSQCITKCINKYDEIVDHASSTLAQIRKNLKACEQDLQKETQRFITTNHSLLMDDVTITRNDRVCVLMKTSEKNSVRGFIHGESASGQASYVEPESLFHLNNKYASLKSKEQEEIEKILFTLSQKVKEHVNSLSANQETFAFLDQVFAKAEYAISNNGCVAHVEEHGRHLLLKEARHPLIAADIVIANTYEIKDPYRSLLITGSNTGGKTVTLKTIGLDACLAQSALPVLATYAKLPFFTDMKADIGDDQSIQESLSTFSSHVSKLASICKIVQSSSLILLDELGSGTDPKEGESLAIAVLDDLRHAQAMVVATTHYSALKSYAKQSDDVLISSVEFDVEHMRPTYRYLEGVSGTSNAFAIARRYHMKECILKKAQQLKDAQTTNQEKLMEKLEKEIQTYQEKTQKMESALQDVRILQQQLILEKQQFEKEKEKQLDEIKTNYREELEAIREQGQAMIQELTQMSQETKPHIIRDLSHRMSQLDIEEEKKIEEAHEWSVGDYVCLVKLNYYGEILDIQKDKVCVLVNGMRMNTKKQELRLASRPKKQTKEQGYQKPKSKAFPMELNVIGFRVVEALALIDKYLDNALLAKVDTVRIIHGNGTGALRKGIHEYLKKHAYVDSFRLGAQGEGGLGASIVTLKKRGK